MTGRYSSWVAVAIATAVLLGIALLLQLIYSGQPQPAPFEFDMTQTKAEKTEYCIGEPIRVIMAGTSRGSQEVIIDVVFSIEQNGVTVFRPRRANSLRYPASLFVGSGEQATVFDTAQFYAGEGSFPRLQPGEYSYRHGIEIAGFNDISFTVPFRVVEC